MAAAILQSQTGATNATSPQSVVLPSAPTSGNFLFYCVDSDTTMTSGPSGATNISNFVSNQGAYLYNKTAGVGESATQTVTPNGAFPNALAVFEISGASALDGNSPVAQTQGTAHASRSISSMTTAAGNGDIVFAVAMLHSFTTAPTTPVWTNGFTHFATIGPTTASNGGTNVIMYIATKQVAASTAVGATTVSWTGNVNNSAAWLVGYTASAGGGTALTASVTDTAAGADSISTTFSLGRTVADPAAGADTVSTTSGFGRQTDDVAAGSDIASTSITYDRTITDSAAGADSVGGVITAAGNLAGTPTDAAGGTDSVSVTVSFGRPFADVAGGSDSVSAVLTGIPINYTVTITDSAGAVDSVTISLQARAYLYSPPTNERVQEMRGALTYHIDQRVTAFKMNGQWGTIQNPGVGYLDTADIVINRPTIVSAAVAAEILASGIGGTFS